MARLMFNLWDDLSSHFWEKKESNDQQLRALRILLTLNILLILAVSISFFTREIENIGDKENYASALVPLLIFTILVLLLKVAKKGYYLIPAWVLVLTYSSASIYSLSKWGIELPEPLLALSLIIALTGLLLGSRAAFTVTLFFAISLFAIVYLHIHHIIPLESSWKSQSATIPDAIIYGFTLLCLYSVAWLSNREIRQSLALTIHTKELLRQERDLLEIRVQERTSELEKAQVDRLLEVQRFIDLGRQTSGLFHDLVSPLSALTISLEQSDEQSEAIHRACQAAERIEALVTSIRRQTRQESPRRIFSPHIEAIHALATFEHRNITIRNQLTTNLNLFGDPIKFYQLTLNLLSNALDACAGASKALVLVKLCEDTQTITLEIEDNGIGISNENMKKIFIPFFTTKELSKGTGLGLAICQDIVVQEFKGILSVTSEPGKTVFQAVLPKE
jgi:signal transduction histidine kinase